MGNTTEQKISNRIMFLVIFLTSSFSICNNIISSFWTILLWSAIAGYCLFKNRKVEKATLIVTALIIGLFGISAIINAEDMMFFFKVSFSIITAFFYINCFSTDIIKKSFYQVMFVLCCISIPLFILCLIMPGLFTSTIDIGTKGRVYYNLYIFSYMVNSGRNGSLFWEPGAFATFINAALALVVLSNKKIKNKRIFVIVLSIALFTTISTTGYFGFAFILMIYLLQAEKTMVRKICLVILVLIMIVIATNTFAVELFDKDGRLFYKFTNFFRYKNDYMSGAYTSSASVRFFSIIMPFRLFLQHPFFGVGVSGLKETTLSYTNGSVTCTFLNWFAETGFVYGAIILAGYIKLIYRDYRKKYEIVLIFILFLLLIISEDYSTNALFLGGAILGYRSINREVDNYEYKQSCV